MPTVPVKPFQRLSYSVSLLVSFSAGLLLASLLYGISPLTTPLRSAPVLVVNSLPPTQQETTRSDRDKVESSSHGSIGRFSVDQVRRAMADPLTYDIWNDLLAFTGLDEDELMKRLTRTGKHHFGAEHAYYEPRSSRELAMYYRASIGYLWANSLHPSVNHSALDLTPADGPILDYSGGVGNIVLGLAKRGIRCVYFGIGQSEFEFAQFRVRRHGLSDFVQFVKPFAKSSDGQGYHFDPVKALKVGPQDTLKQKLGAIFAVDVFEHIPNYEVTARHLVTLLRNGGKLFENTVFDGTSDENSIHLRAKVPLSEALRGMKKVRTVKTNKVSSGYVPTIVVWVKESKRTVM